MKTQCLQTNEIQHYLKGKCLRRERCSRERVALIKSLIYTRWKETCLRRGCQIELKMSADIKVFSGKLISDSLNVIYFEIKPRYNARAYIWPTSRRQFHQHFTHEFFLRKFVLSKTLRIEKLPKRLLYKKGERKTLMKLTPAYLFLVLKIGSKYVQQKILSQSYLTLFFVSQFLLLRFMFVTYKSNLFCYEMDKLYSESWKNNM